VLIIYSKEMSNSVEQYK